MSFIIANEHSLGTTWEARKRIPTASQRSASSKPDTPFTNRGVENTGSLVEFSVHWLTGTTYLELEDVLDLIADLLEGADFVAFNYGINRYKKMYQTLGGLKILCEPADEDTMPPVCVVVPGQACELLGFHKLQSLATILKPTRLDLAFDGAPFSPLFLYEQYKQGNVRTRVRAHDYVHPKTGKAKHWSIERNPNGDTFYLGSKTSTWYMCAYDERSWTRLELRLQAERAELAYEALTGDAESFKQTALGWLRAFCDYIDTSNTTNKTRAPLLDFWADLIGDIAKVPMALAGKAIDTLEKTVAWLENQVSASLVVFTKAGYSLFDLLKLGEKNMKGRHRALLTLAGCT